MSLLIRIAETVFDLVAPAVMDRRRVRFTVHPAVFSQTQTPAYFLTFTNLSREREIELTHVWLDTAPPVSATHDARALPKRLKPDEIWETWIFEDEVPLDQRDRVVELARARLSTGRDLRARPNPSVPPSGFVPGDQVR